MKRKDPILTNDLRETLKEVMKSEISNLPETLKQLDPVSRMNILCKLMPFVFPKVENVQSTSGEPFSF